MSHSGKKGHHKVLALVESSLDLPSKVIGVVGELYIFTSLTIFVHHSQKSIIRDINKRILHALHDGDLSSVGGGDDIFVLLSSENVDRNEIALSVAVLSSLGGGNRTDLCYYLYLDV